MTRGTERLRKLLQQNRLKLRAAELVSRWASQGVATSPVVHERYWKLIDRIRRGRSWPLDYVDDLAAAVSDFTGNCDMVTIIGWNLEEEPPLLVSSRALLQAIHRIDSLYPDGFWLIDDDSRTALMVDIDEEEGIHANRIDLLV
ncbi:MAG TPA: hypothetical protein VF662_09235 [Allosphingosinicella sp.]|jgi:hypothetical protein